MSDNVLDFNALKAKREEAKFDEITDRQMTDEEFFAQVAFSATLDIVDVLIENGYNPENNVDSIRDIFLVIEAIRGLGHRSINEPHHSQLIADAAFNFIENEEDVLAEFLDKLEE